MADEKSGLYLGDLDTVIAILRAKISHVCDAVSDTDDPKKQMRIIAAGGRSIAHIFLGDNPFVRPVAGWNEAGRIDEAMAEWLSLDDAGPINRLCHAFARMLLEVIEISHKVETGELPNGQWEPTAAAVILRYARMFCGQFPDGIGQ